MTQIRDITELRTQRYWRTATPAQRIMYSWLTGEDAPTAPPHTQQRRRQYRKASRARQEARYSVPSAGDREVA